MTFNITISQHPMLTHAVDARELWKALKSGQKFTDWIDSRIATYGFSEGIDYVKHDDEVLLHNSMKHVYKSNNAKEYTISLDMAKELAMVERTEPGKIARLYFIECEKKLYSTASILSPSTQDVLLIAAELKKHLSLPQSGYIDVLGRGLKIKAPELLPMLPSYGIDTSPVGLVTTGSSKPTFALTTLLKRNNLPYSAVGFNRLLVSTGVLIDMARPSTTRGTKSYKAISDDWLHYGKNVISPTNPRETQPHWYDDTFMDLVDRVTK